MSKEDFDAKKSLIIAIDDHAIKRPNMPIDTALQEAENLHTWCRTDKELLVKASLAWKLVEDLPVRIGACRYTESQWQKERRSKKNAEKEWKSKRKEAVNLRNELLHHFNFAYNNSSDIKAALKKIAEGGTQADMIQDLSDLAALGKAYPEPLKAITIDLRILDRAALLADEAAVLLARSNSARVGSSPQRILRDKAFLHMKEAVDEIRRVGQYIFWRDEERKKGYISQYLKKKNRKSLKDIKKANE